MSKNSIAIKGNMEQAEVAELLEGLVSSFKAGTVCVRKGSEFVTLKPVGRIDFEIEAECKKGKQGLTIEIKWEEEVMLKPCCEGFSISATEPEPAPEAEAVAEAAPAPVMDSFAPAAQASMEPETGSKKKK